MSQQTALIAELTDALQTAVEWMEEYVEYVPESMLDDLNAFNKLILESKTTLKD